MKYFFAFLLLSSVLFATNVNADFEQQSSGYQTDTSMQFTTSFVLSLHSGEVISGDPNDLETGDSVCTGARLTITPTVNAKWATSGGSPDFDADAIFPVCDPAYEPYCPSTSSLGSVSNNRNINWLSSSRRSYFVSHFSSPNDYLYGYSDHSNLAELQSVYNELSPFSSQPVTYHVEFGGPTYSNKRGEVGVYCDGTLRLSGGGGSTTRASPFSTSSWTSSTINTPGSYDFKTQIEGIDCFGVVLKYPTNLNDGHSEFFYMNFYTDNLPSITSPAAVSTVTIDIEEDGGECSIALGTQPIEITYGSQIGDLQNFMVKAQIRNTGADAINLTGSIVSSNADYVALAFPTASCGVLGIPPALCPASNGFETSLSAGVSRYVYIWLVDTDAAASGGTTLTVYAETSSPMCGDAEECSVDIDLTGPITCEVVPDPMDVPENYEQRFNVTCTDLDLDPIACSGTDWAWVPGTFGTISTHTNTYVLATPTAAVGSTGEIEYTSDDVAVCSAQVTVLPDIDTPVECTIVPPNADVGQMELAQFNVTCINSLGDEIPCASTNWYWEMGFSGYFVTQTEEDATVYSDEAVGSTGELFFEPSIYAICSANMTIISPTYVCVFDPDDVIVNMTDSQHFNFTCYENLAETDPDDAEYNLINTLTGVLSNDDIHGVDYTAPALGTEGDVEGIGYFDTGTHIIGAVDWAHVLVPDENSPTDCTITPAVYSMGPYEWATFEVECTNFFGVPVACVGNNWYWGDGLTGGFISATNTEAEAYSTSSVGSTGKLYYASIDALCFSDVTLIAPTYVCDLTPDSVVLAYSDSQHFDFACTVAGVATAPDDSDYQLVDGLTGSLSNPAINGVDYDAPAVDSQGNVLAVGTFNAAPAPLGGAVDLSFVRVQNDTEECVGDDCNPGDSDDCRILAPSPWFVSEGTSAWVGIMCGVDGDEVCSSVVWSLGPPTAGWVHNGNNHGTWYTITGNPGQTGTLYAEVGTDAECYRDFEIVEQDCDDLS
ncbi:MAG: hypothetical protein ABH842_03925 [Candidatus Micrarchaeota archaeon]